MREVQAKSTWRVLAESNHPYIVCFVQTEMYWKPGFLLFEMYITVRLFFIQRGEMVYKEIFVTLNP